MMKREVKNILKQLIKKYFLEGKADKLKTEGIAEIKTILKSQNLSFFQFQPEIIPLIKSVEKELGQKFFFENVKPFEQQARQELKSIIEHGRYAVTENQRKIESIITKTLTEDVEDIEKALTRNLRKIKLEQRHIDTEIRTTKLALNNLSRAASYKSAGTKYLRYAGPSGAFRPFCQAHINRIYKLEEVENMVNQFGQPALIYSGGWNCPHYWVPVDDDGEMEGNLFVDSSWNEQFENASKNEKEVMLQEKEFARKVSRLGYKAELNYSLKDVQNKDTDLVFEGQYTQLKQPKSSKDVAIRSALKKSWQADSYIIEIPDTLSQPEISINNIKKFLERHPEKSVYLFNKKNNKLEKIEL